MITNSPLVSICVPAYKEAGYVKRLLESILIQDHDRLEIIISDDSTDTAVEEVYKQFSPKAGMELRYFRHSPSLGTPVNWNFALDQARGDYHMLMHQDDYFATPHSISTYLNAFVEDKGLDFVFSRNTPVYDDGVKVKGVRHDEHIVKNLKEKADHLVGIYVIGPPSNIMLSKNIITRFDPRFIWLVDVDFCVRAIESGANIKYLDEHLVTIGMHDNQATVYCQQNPGLILRENILYAEKRPLEAFKKIWLYDYFWRLMRNHGVRSITDITDTGVAVGEIILPIRDILDAQQKFPLSLLRNGFFSKAMMFKTWLFNRHKYNA